MRGYVRSRPYCAAGPDIPRFRWRLFGGAILLCWVWLATVMPAFAQDAPDYQLGAGDRLRVTVFGNPDLSGEFDVSGSGTISLPLIGDVMARGRNVSEVEKAVAAKLQPDYLRNPRVSIDVLNYRPFYIIGEVKNPGSYPYVSGMRVVNAIALAGGFTYRARESRLLIKRANSEDGRQEPADQNTVVLPGDVIEVPERFF